MLFSKASEIQTTFVVVGLTGDCMCVIPKIFVGADEKENETSHTLMETGYSVANNHNHNS